MRCNSVTLLCNILCSSLLMRIIRASVDTQQAHDAMHGRCCVFASISPAQMFALVLSWLVGLTKLVNLKSPTFTYQKPFSHR